MSVIVRHPEPPEILLETEEKKKKAIANYTSVTKFIADQILGSECSRLALAVYKTGLLIQRRI